MVERIKVLGGVLALAGISVFFSVFAFSVVPDGKRSEPFIDSLIVWAVMGWFVVIPEIIKLVRLQWVMGETACQEREDKIALMKSTFLTQEIVDSHLCELAFDAESLFLLQVQLREDDEESHLEEVTEEIVQRKEYFWVVQKLVKDLGFEVRPKIKDYTTNWDQYNAQYNK